MSNILEQDEVDALLHGVDSGTVDTAPHSPEGVPSCKEYDFKTQARIVRGRMPTLEMINERLARLLRLSLGSTLHRAPEITLQGVTTPKYADYIQSLSVPTSLSHIRFHPFTGTGLVIFEAKLVFAMIDAFFGGNGRHATIAGRDFTPTENQLIEILFEQVTAGVKQAWTPVMDVAVELIKRENNPTFAKIVSPTDIVVVNRLQIDLEGRGGEIHIALPYSMLEPLKDTLRAGVQSDRAEHEEHWAQSLRNELEETDVDFVTRLATSRMTFGELLNAKPGDVLPCDFDGRATVISDGIPLFWGEFGQQGGKQVVRVAQLNTRKAGNLLDGFVRKSS